MLSHELAPNREQDEGTPKCDLLGCTVREEEESNIGHSQEPGNDTLGGSECRSDQRLNLESLLILQEDNDDYKNSEEQRPGSAEELQAQDESVHDNEMPCGHSEETISSRWSKSVTYCSESEESEYFDALSQLSQEPGVRVHEDADVVMIASDACYETDEDLSDPELEETDSEAAYDSQDLDSQKTAVPADDQLVPSSPGATAIGSSQPVAADESITKRKDSSSSEEASL